MDAGDESGWTPVADGPVFRYLRALREDGVERTIPPDLRGDRFCAERVDMIFPSNRVRIVVATKPVDFRKQHDGLVAHVKSALHKDPFTGTVFLFRAKRADRLKLVYWDGTGLVMVYKRLEEQGFVWPAIRDGVMSLSHAQFEALFAGLDWRRVRALSAGRSAEAE